MRTILITGGAGLIGSVVMREIIQHTADRVVVVDRLAYAGSLISLAPVAQDTRFAFGQVNICDRGKLDRIFRQHQPDTVMHLAAEGHVDRPIGDPMAFIETNILGTYTLLEAARSWWNTLATEKRSAFRFHHISAGKVYDDLHGGEDFFIETVPYAPNSPYSASGANGDHLVRAWLRIYSLPTSITSCSNNYDPYHFPEKLIPLTILNALTGKPLPVYGNGQQIRDWLYVEDHAKALYSVTTRGGPDETYNIGSHNKRRNIEVVETICRLPEELAPHKPQSMVHYHGLVTFVADRPGHDLRYTIDASRIAHELGWTPAETFISGMRKTVAWYLANEGWQCRAQDGSYQDERLELQDQSSLGGMMKGIILAGGSGTRLHPITRGISKQLLPIYDKPMVYYPLSVLVLAGIHEILIVTAPDSLRDFQRLLGDGSEFGVALHYAVQPTPDGLAQAFIIDEAFLNDEPACLVLGDNIFFDQSSSPKLRSAAARIEGATISGYQVMDPERFDVVEFDDNFRVLSLEEKPKRPKSDWAVAGLYFYNDKVTGYAKRVKPPERGKLGITSINQMYLEDDVLTVELLGRSFAWLDTGTHDGLIGASIFVQTVEKRQGFKIVYLGGIDWCSG